SRAGRPSCFLAMAWITTARRQRLMARFVDWTKKAWLFIRSATKHAPRQNALRAKRWKTQLRNCLPGTLFAGLLRERLLQLFRVTIRIRCLRQDSREQLGHLACRVLMRFSEDDAGEIA